MDTEKAKYAEALTNILALYPVTLTQAQVSDLNTDVNQAITAIRGGGLPHPTGPRH